MVRDVSEVQDGIRRYISRTPRPIFRARYVQSSWHSVGAEKAGFGKIAPRAFRRRIVRRWHCWCTLGCRAIELGKPPQEGVNV